MRSDRLTPEQIAALRKVDFNKQKGFVDSEVILSKEAGKKETKQRVEEEAKAMAWYYGELLGTLRKERNMTQRELAEKACLKRSYIAKIEKGDTDLQLSSFIKIASALGLTVQLT
ncbi:MAG: helix-turn-helix transcriptional regulator [Bacteroidales bacterium]|nr:helix-turn-helix transcriptional regulator [Bacteroidales bacterium]MDD4671216.1 helix-turn-helix transcriptional regulator [Bacteroidales bacterium]